MSPGQRPRLPESYPSRRPAATGSSSDKVPRRNDGAVHVGDLVLISTKDLVTLDNRTACPRLSSRFVGPFKVVDPPPEEPAENYGRSKNYVWLALPITLGAIRQPINLARLRRFVERPAHLGTVDLPPHFPPHLPPHFLPRLPPHYLPRLSPHGRLCSMSLDGMKWSCLRINETPLSTRPQ